jgi:hypothetical protein
MRAVHSDIILHDAGGFRGRLPPTAMPPIHVPTTANTVSEAGVFQSAQRLNRSAECRYASPTVAIDA